MTQKCYPLPVCTNSFHPYRFSGYYNAKASVNYSECHAIVQKVVSKYKVDKPLELLQHDIVAFSYYFDRATEVGLVGEC